MNLSAKFQIYTSSDTVWKDSRLQLFSLPWRESVCGQVDFFPGHSLQCLRQIQALDIFWVVAKSKTTNYVGLADCFLRTLEFWCVLCPFVNNFYSANRLVNDALIYLRVI